MDDSARQGVSEAGGFKRLKEVADRLVDRNEGGNNLISAQETDHIETQPKEDLEMRTED